MKRRRKRARGYTLGELMLSSTIVIGVGLGGLGAVITAAKMDRRFEGVPLALAHAAALDRAVLRGHGVCDVLPDTAGEPTTEAIAACRAHLKVGTVPHVRRGTLPNGLQYVVTVPTLLMPGMDGYAGLLPVETRYRYENQEVLRHVVLAEPR